MHYSATYKHIDIDFGVSGDLRHSWSTEYTEPEALILDLNRMAITSSQHVMVEFPEVELRTHSERVTIRAIQGQLYYDDLHSPNRKNLKVIPDEALRLLQGQAMEEVFKRPDEADDYYCPPRRRAPGWQTAWLAKVMSVALMLGIWGVCSNIIWKDLSRKPRLHQAPTFVPALSNEGAVLRKYAGIYVDEYREGAMLFELTESGELNRYEMWHSAERNGFVLTPVDTHRVQVGLHNGKISMLGGEIYLLMPKDEDNISLLGVNFQRHQGKLRSIGEVLNGPI